MIANPGLYPAPASAKVLLKRLIEVSEVGDDIDTHLFHGINNSNKKNTHHIYCYCISFLQMFLHCNDCIEYFYENKSLNKNEKLIHDIIESFFKKSNTKSINIHNFIEKWRGWNGNSHLPHKMTDISLFIQYFLKSLSNPIKELFKINVNSEEKEFYGEVFFLTISSIADTIQKNVDLKINHCGKIITYPKYLILYVDRSENGNGFKTNYIAVNTYLNISDENYKFSSAILFTGSYNSGHYTNLIKIGGKYFYFNDENVYSCFYTQKPTAKTPNIIYDVNNGLNRNSNVLLYELTEEEIDPNAFEVFEKSIFTEDKVAQNLSGVFSDFHEDPNFSRFNSGSFLKGDETYSSNLDSGNNDPYFQSESLSTDHNIFSDSNDSESLPIFYERRTNSQPRPFYNNNNSMQSFDSAPLSPLIDRTATAQSITDEVLGSNITVSSHLNLNRTKVDVETLNATNLSGTMNINIDGVPSCTTQRVEAGKYALYRKLFKYAGFIFKKLDYNDLGATNAEIIKDKKNIEPIDQKDVQFQGYKAYCILTQIVLEGEFNFKKFNNALSPIVKWYKEKYSKLPRNDFSYSKKIDDNIEESLSNELLSQKEMKSFLPIRSPLTTVSDDDDDDEPINESINFKEKDLVFDYDIEEEEEEEEEEEKVVEEIKVEEDVNEEVAKKIIEKDPIINIRKTQKEKVLHKKDNESCKHKIQKHNRLGYLNWVPEENISEQSEIDCIIDDDFEFCEDNNNDDDNQFYFGEYNWKERSEFLDAKRIREEIMNGLDMHSDDVPRGKLQLRSLIIQEFLQDYVRTIKHYDSRRDFVNDYIARNSVDTSKSPLVKEYEDIIKKENEIRENRKERKKRKPDSQKVVHQKREKKTTFLYGYSTLMDKISWFESRTPKEQEEILSQAKIYNEWGGERPDVSIVTDQTLDCLLSLVLDFPTMSCSQYTCYLNSKYGPHFEKKISVRTVYSCLLMLNLTVKKASFAPPNRNSVGLRIFRVAWCMFIEKILGDKNILLGFIDEAAVTSNQKRNFGRAFAGLTPVINCPLKKVKMSILSIVFPGFGTLYKFCQKSVDGTEYAQFLSDVNEFARKYICNNSAEILIVEDNCPIHNTKCVEAIIEQLKISLIPIVPYSPALNGVVEGYFGFIKLKNIQSDGDNELVQRKFIEESWKKLSNEKFTVEIAQNLYKEWLTRMKECKAGKPLVSGHITVSTGINVSDLINLTVNRVNENN